MARKVYVAEEDILVCLNYLYIERAEEELYVIPVALKDAQIERREDNTVNIKLILDIK